MKIFNLEKARKHYDEIKDNPIYCEKAETWNSGDNFMITDIPCTYQGMDCYLSFGWEDSELFSSVLYMNHYLDYDCYDCPYWDDEILISDIDVFSDIIEELSDAFAKMRAEIEMWTDWDDGYRVFNFDKYYHN